MNAYRHAGAVPFATHRTFCWQSDEVRLSTAKNRLTIGKFRFQPVNQDGYSCSNGQIDTSQTDIRHKGIDFAIHF